MDSDMPSAGKESNCGCPQAWFPSIKGHNPSSFCQVFVALHFLQTIIFAFFKTFCLEFINHPIQTTLPMSTFTSLIHYFASHLKPI